MDHSNDKPNHQERSQLIRLLYMLLFGVILYLSLLVLVVVVLVQFIFALFAGEANDGIRNFSRDLSRYIYQIAMFLTYNNERRPFPFNPLEDVSPASAQGAEYTADYHDISNEDDNKPHP